MYLYACRKGKRNYLRFHTLKHIAAPHVDIRWLLFYTVDEFEIAVRSAKVKNELKFLLH